MHSSNFHIFNTVLVEILSLAPGQQAVSLGSLREEEDGKKKEKRHAV